MTTPYDVPPNDLISKLALALKQDPALTPPEWANFVKTGVHKEKAPVDPDWWFVRSAATLRKIYLNGPIGTERLASEFGGRRDRGSAPYHARTGSRSIARKCLQALEKGGYLAKSGKKGRIVSSKGRSLLDKCSQEVIQELGKTNKELLKYA
jgi:small subunit ribosomal protein S19e